MTIILTAMVTTLVVAFVLFCSLDRAGGEIGFDAVITKVEDGMAYAAVTGDEAGFLSQKLPGDILFYTDILDTALEAGDTIHGCDLSGTIAGQHVRVVSVTVIDQTG